jgi:hypothetical protein
MNLLNAADVQVDFFGLDGQYYGQQVNEKTSAGQQTFTLELRAICPVGFYFVRIQVGDAGDSRKIDCCALRTANKI